MSATMGEQRPIVFVNDETKTGPVDNDVLCEDAKATTFIGIDGNKAGQVDDNVMCKEAKARPMHKVGIGNAHERSRCIG